MKSIIFFVLMLLVLPARSSVTEVSTAAEASTFDDLLNAVKRQSEQELAVESERLGSFKSAHHEHEYLLKQAESQLAKLKSESKQLADSIDKNEKNLTDTEERLERKVGDLGELFGATRQAAGELKAEFANSLISAQIQHRSDFLEDLAQSRKLPEAAQLRELWFLMLQEMGETGKTRKFQTGVVQSDGTTKMTDVVRYGSYVAVADEKILQYLPETQSFVTLAQRPATRFSNTAKNSSNKSGLHKIMIDPTRGQLLELLTRKKSLDEQIQQGGVVGYIIIALGVIGVILSIYRYHYLQRELTRVNRQAKKITDPTADNALGRIALVYQNTQEKSFREQEVALEEAMLREVPGIESYSGMLKLLAAVAPLLGLLGTVIGMIITFQSITLFGTSDPKLMAGGISTALVTTVLGLIVSIPLLFAHTLISAKAKQILDLIEHQSVGLIARRGA
ncbi:MAG: MotA/TolQ/ExbB proton channel family protein [Paraglaciecola sp.]|nr:MotA/TolQ/ExbB proton channel family protein [Paraglaciecola sp.]